MKKIALFLSLIILSFNSYAFEFEGGNIAIPETFLGPVIEKYNKNSRSIAFTKPHSKEGDTGALLQLTVWGSDRALPELSNEGLKAAAEKYLLQFVGAIKKRRDNYSQSEVEYLTIANQPAAKINWQGSLNGKVLHGIMYCYITNNKIINLHTQDYVEYQGGNMLLATRAFEAIQAK